MKLQRLYRLFQYYARKQEGRIGFGAIPALIGTIIAIVVGVNLIGPITETTKTITDATTTMVVSGITTTTPVYSSAISSLVGVLPFIFVAVIILGAVAWIGGFGFGGSSEEKEEKKKEKATYEGQPVLRTNSAHTISVVEKASEALLWFQNDLEGLLGIKTETDNHKYFGLSLESNTLLINEEDYDWYITAKQKDENVFKVVGLNKADAANNVVYVLGKWNDIHPENVPFLIKIPTDRVEDEIRLPKQMSVEGRN
jgi:hypothetical protein